MKKFALLGPYGSLFPVLIDMLAKGFASQGILGVLVNQLPIKPLADAVVHLVAIHRSDFFLPPVPSKNFPKLSNRKT